VSVTNIAPKTYDVYWFVDLGDFVLSGVTTPGLVTTTEFTIEQNEDWKILATKLEETNAKVVESGHEDESGGGGFRRNKDGKIVFGGTDSLSATK
jgi:hypothetical protein